MANRVLVCVTKQKTCERLIKTGARLAKEAGDAELLVVHVLHRDDNILGNMMQGDALEFLFQISKQAVSYTHLDVYKRQVLPALVSNQSVWAMVR